MEDTNAVQEIRDLRAEIREYRDEVSQWRQELGERVATIEEQIRPTIVGNGQPSRLAVVEAQVDELQHGSWRLGGIIAGVTGVWALLTFGFEIVRHRLGF